MIYSRNVEEKEDPSYSSNMSHNLQNTSESNHQDKNAYSEQNLTFGNILSKKDENIFRIIYNNVNESELSIHAYKL